MAPRPGGTPRSCGALLLLLALGGQIAGAVPVFTSYAELKIAVDACLGASSYGLCPNQQDGALIGTWKTSAVTSMATMFMNAAAFNQSLSAWDTSAVTSMKDMFSGAKAFNSDLSAWNVSAVTSMETMFNGASAFNQDLSAWDVSAVTSMIAVFNSARAFNQVLCSAAWLSSTADKFNMFSGTSGSKICSYLPPSSPPPPPASCGNSCYGTTCLGLASVPCSILTHMNCTCTGCCNSAAATGVECGPDHIWSEADSHCVLNCTAFAG